MQDHGVDDVAVLLRTPPPDLIQDPVVWEKYATYWCQDEQRVIPTHNRQNRMTPVSGPDGKPAGHSLRSNNLHERMRKRFSALNIHIGLNKRRTWRQKNRQGTSTTRD
ncbi:hypothetical protein LIER_22030 [Lithospermum erythrorhizon]|uniref:Uncharacterized protein n=1 Tax=Lithospermum erythrorhizon TaxID=34254 RepID=A0AAV3QVG8_LITER